MILQEDSWTYLCFLVPALKMWQSRHLQLWAGAVLLSINPILLGGGQICPHPHVFAYTHVCMRIHVPIFFDFSSFLVCMKVQNI